MSAIIEGSDVVVPLADRVLGRVTAEDVLKPGNDDEIVIAAGTLLDEHLVKVLEENKIDHLKVRSVITCETRRGACAKCYGRDLSRGHQVNIGEAVGVIAAQSIGEPGTQLTMRTFHIGGAASQSTLQNSVVVQSKGKLKFHNLKTVKNNDKQHVAVSRSGELVVSDEFNRERERYKLPYGAILPVNDGAKVKAGDTVANWDPHTHPVVTEVAGKVVFADMIDGVTMQHKTDELTGLSSIVIMDNKSQRSSSKELKPSLCLVDAEGNEVCFPNTSIPVSHSLPVGAVVTVNEKDEVHVGDILARIPQEGSKNKDITGGLPRVADLFEARKPKEPAIMAETSGVVSFGKETKGKRRLVITPEGQDSVEIMIPKHRHINVFEGEHVAKGDVICDGPLSPHDIIRLQGIAALTNYLVNEIQDVYRLQGVGINDKHIEVIVRQMLRRVEITGSGDSRLIVSEQTDLLRVLEENDKLKAEGKMPAEYVPVLLGLIKASLSTESFMSAAAFQETTRVLTEASVNGRVDVMFGLKENVTVGRLIPAGTGLTARQVEQKRVAHEAELEAQGPTAAEIEEALSAALSGGMDDLPPQGVDLGPEEGTPPKE